MVWRAMRKSGSGRSFSSLAKVIHAEVHLRLRLQREDQEFKRCRWKWIFLVAHPYFILTVKHPILHGYKILIGPRAAFRLLSDCKTCPVGAGLLVGFPAVVLADIFHSSVKFS